jgi:lipopolysaccharide/colanic/teichoic acid biosynthesis glycosyltransferase
LIGPRPHALGSEAGGKLFWVAANNYWARHSIKPGITGLSQIRGYRGGEITEEEIELRVSSDLEYVNNWSILLDIKILIKTITVVVHPKAY